jgi:hypothetical protein
VCAVGAGVEEYVDNQKHPPTWKIQLCLIVDALVYVRVRGAEIHAESSAFLTLYAGAGFLSAVVLPAFAPRARSRPAPPHDRWSLLALLSPGLLCMARALQNHFVSSCPGISSGGGHWGHPGVGPHPSYYRVVYVMQSIRYNNL